MTEAEAGVVAGILAEADGCCIVCAGNLARSASQEFPDFDWFDLVAKCGGWTPESLKDPS